MASLHSHESATPQARRRFLRVNNVARRLGKSERTVRWLAGTGAVPAFKIDKKSWGFWPEDVEAHRCRMGGRDERQ